MEDFDKLWNYSDPATTELTFRETLLANTEREPSYLLQLNTQIARTYSLRGLFNEAHSLLDEVESSLPAAKGVAHIRYHLERGRTFNTADKKKDAKGQFELAKALAESLHQDFYYLDAVHMLAIIATPAESVKLHAQAIIMAEDSTDEKAKNWLGALYNNLGWAHFDRGEYEQALSVFLRALQWRETKKSDAEIFLAKWCVARTLRALNRIDDAIKIQLALFEEATNTGNQDGYVSEELGELFLLKNERLKYPFHFEKAYELLSTDKFLQQSEPARLERIKKLAGL